MTRPTYAELGKRIAPLSAAVAKLRPVALFIAAGENLSKLQQRAAALDRQYQANREDWRAARRDPNRLDGAAALVVRPDPIEASTAVAAGPTVSELDRAAEAIQAEAHLVKVAIDEQERILPSLKHTAAKAARAEIDGKYRKALERALAGMDAYDAAHDEAEGIVRVVEDLGLPFHNRTDLPPPFGGENTAEGTPDGRRQTLAAALVERLT